MNIVIIGAGLAGLSTAYHLTKEYEIFEQDSRAGGLCRSEKEQDFIFDYTGHLLHLKTDYVKILVKSLLKDNLHIQERNSWIYSKGVYTRYPFQSNTYGLPIEVIKECVLGFIKAKYEYGDKKIKTFEDWIINNFGVGIYKHFMAPYNEKIWTVHPREMVTDWVRDFVPNPSIEEVIEGALTDQKKKVGYNAQFYYPLKGGIESLSQAFANYIKNNIYFNKKLLGVDTKKKLVEFQDGEVIEYDILVSTIPLPLLVNCIKDVPDEIKKATSKLRWCSVYNLNLGVNKEISDKHWIYFPEKEFVFYRVGFASNLSPYMAPKGTSSIYTEVSYAPCKPIDKKTIDEKVIQGLIKSKIIKSKEEIFLTKKLDLYYAYVICDSNWKSSTKKINSFLKSNEIYSIGRYGTWEYSAMEDTILQGKRLAEIINQRREG